MRKVLRDVIERWREFPRWLCGHPDTGSHRADKLSVALSFAGVALATRWAVDPWLGDRHEFLPAYVAVFAASWLGTWRSGLVCALLFWVPGEWLFGAPRSGADAARLHQMLADLAYWLICGLLVMTADRAAATYGALRERVADLGEATICVKDPGVGIAPDDVTAIFGSFVQVGPSGARSHGLGLGFALCKKLVELHGGAIEARSEGKGRGAEFRVRIPRRPELAARAVGPVARLFVFLDIGLADMSGYELARRIRQCFEERSPALIALGGIDAGEDVPPGDAFAQYLVKPVGREEIAQALTVAANRLATMRASRVQAPPSAGALRLH